MLLLEGANRTVSSLLAGLLTKDKEASVSKVGDFHGSSWEIYHDGEGSVFIGITMHVSKGKLKKWGLFQHLEAVYGKDALVDDEDTPEFLTDIPDVCIVLKDADQFRSDDDVMTKGDRAKLQEFCDKYASLYHSCLWCVFSHHFEMSRDGDVFDPVKVSYRESESMYLQGRKDNLAVHYSMVFQTEDDLLYGRLFLQEFADIKKHKRNLAAAPSCSVSKERPKDLGSVKGVEAEAENRLWITLSLFTKHIDPKVVNNTVDLLLQFSNYVRYHISCSHAYIHSRMRSRHVNLLQVCFAADPRLWHWLFAHYTTLSLRPNTHTHAHTPFSHPTGAEPCQDTPDRPRSDQDCVGETLPLPATTTTNTNTYIKENKEKHPSKKTTKPSPSPALLRVYTSANEKCFPRTHRAPTPPPPSPFAVSFSYPLPHSLPTSASAFLCLYNNFCPPLLVHLPSLCESVPFSSVAIADKQTKGGEEEAADGGARVRAQEARRGMGWWQRWCRQKGQKQQLRLGRGRECRQGRVGSNVSCSSNESTPL